MTLDKIYDWACSKLKTEDVESMEKANPKLSNALKSMLILAKAGVKEAEVCQATFMEMKTERFLSQMMRKITIIDLMK